MRVALEEGRKALPACLPNPPVGCVLVRGGAIVAVGHTQRPGEAHAEAMALSCIDGDLSDITAYVTLEPCSFHGRTPSCASAFIAKGLKHVVMAVLDPDPRNSGRGIEMLEQAGVRVELGTLETEATMELSRYLALPANLALQRSGSP